MLKGTITFTYKLMIIKWKLQYLLLSIFIKHPKWTRFKLDKLD